MRLLCIVEHGDAPSIRLRLKDCLPVYQRLGIETTILTTQRSNISAQIRILRAARQHDVVVLFKTIGFSSLELTLLRHFNPRIIFDFDDAVMFREQKYEKPLTGRNFEKFRRTLAICSAAAAGNSFLDSFAEGCGVRAVILPTSIDLTKYQVKESQSASDGLTIGWVGLSDGLRYLRHIQPALRRLSEKFPGFRLKVVSDKPLELDGVRIQNEPWRMDTEQEQLRSFDIGIMPLWDSVWTRGKCGYKILQYMAVGTAVVASDVGVNGEIISSGENGFVARTENDWVASIATLVENSDQRRAFGMRGRKVVEERFSLERYAARYAELFREVADSSRLTKPQTL
jgi:glycosyltransferase involved in cell wall biosynthesis